MNQEAILWLFGTVITVQMIVVGTLFKLIISHMKECRTFAEILVRVDGNVNRLMADIGSYDTGLRGQVNVHQGKLQEHDFRLGALDEWRKTVGVG